MILKKVFGNYVGLPKEAKYLVYASVMPAVAYGMLFTDLAYFLTAVQGMSADFMGLVLTLMGVSTFFASIFLGIAADIYGRKRMLIGGNILASVTIMIFALTTDPFLLIIAAIFEGISEAAVLASSSALLADKARNENRNSIFSLYGFAQGIAFGVGSFVIPAVLIFEQLGFTNKESHILLYFVISILSLVSTAIMLRVNESKSLKKDRKSYLDLFPRKSKNVLLKYTLTAAVVAFGAGMVIPLMTFWFDLRYGISDAISAPILAISSILIGLTILVAPWAAKRFGLVRAIVITQTASTFFLLITPLSSNFLLAGFVYSIRALLMNMSNPLSQSMIMGLVAEDERGAASGMNGALWRLPNALSSFIGAWLMGMGFLAEPFFIAGIFYSLSTALFWVFFRRVKMPEEEFLESTNETL
jgi:MFS family permease